MMLDTSVPSAGFPPALWITISPSIDRRSRTFTDRSNLALCSGDSDDPAVLNLYSDLQLAVRVKERLVNFFNLC